MKKLLIVDDQAGIRMLLCEVFIKAGYQTFPAANGIEALQLLITEKPDCIILDLQMPGMNGTEFLKEIRIEWPNIPVVLMTANDRTTISEDLLENVSHFLIKPFDINEVQTIIKQLLES